MCARFLNLRRPANSCVDTGRVPASHHTYLYLELLVIPWSEAFGNAQRGLVRGLTMSLFPGPHPVLMAERPVRCPHGLILHGTREFPGAFSAPSSRKPRG